MSVQKIQDNMKKSFKGTFRNAMKNGYDLDTHYVIVDWKFFHELLHQEKNTKEQKIGCGAWIKEAENYGWINCGDILSENEESGKVELCARCKCPKPFQKTSLEVNHGT